VASLIAFQAHACANQGIVTMVKTHVSRVLTLPTLAIATETQVEDATWSHVPHHEARQLVRAGAFSQIDAYARQVIVLMTAGSVLLLRGA